MVLNFGCMIVIVFAICGSCVLDWPFAVGNIIIAAAITPVLNSKHKELDSNSY